MSLVLHIAEPPASYLSRPAAVVDASLLVALIYGEPEAERAESSMRPYALHAPAILPLEVTNAAMNKLRRQVASWETLAERLANFDFSCIRLQDARPVEIFRIARRHSLSAYDASYLWLAGELKAPLLTFDERLAAAARDHLAQLPP